MTEEEVGQLRSGFCVALVSLVCTGVIGLFTLRTNGYDAHFASTSRKEIEQISLRCHL